MSYQSLVICGLHLRYEATFTFGDVKVLINSGPGKGFGLAVGPADFDGVDLRFLSQAEVEAEVAAGVIAGSAADFVDPGAVLSVESNSGSDSIAVGAGSG
jgi:hypothetical protein